jgi:hypothetical protein
MLPLILLFVIFYFLPPAEKGQGAQGDGKEAGEG